MLHADTPEFWYQLLAALGLVAFSGMMSGLTLGLMSLEVLDVELTKRSDNERERQMAATVQELVKDQHRLLVTLLFCNAIAMEALPLVLDTLVSPVMAVIISVTAVLLFGEIVPQAVCKTYGMAVGAACAPLVRFLLVVCFPVAWPISKLLDRVLGGEGGTFYRRPQISAILDIHKEVGHLTTSETSVMQGALELVNKQVSVCMTPWESVKYLEHDRKLDKETIEWILECGHSRIPVCTEDGATFAGVLLTKQLIKHVGFQPEAFEPPVVSSLPLHNIIHVPESMQLYTLLDLFSAGHSHMAVVYPADANLTDAFTRSKDASMIGIVTLENVLEELIKQEIVDETDQWVHASTQSESADERRKKLRGKAVATILKMNVRPGRSRSFHNMPKDLRAQLLEESNRAGMASTP